MYTKLTGSEYEATTSDEGYTVSDDVTKECATSVANVEDAEDGRKTSSSTYIVREMK